MKSRFYDSIPLPDYEQIINCIHCGMCLPVCPTYELSGLEKHSPRGRIRMIKAVAEGDLDLTDNFRDSIDYCLDCQACVTACPAGVEYGQLVEAAKLHVEAHNRANGRGSFIKDFALNWIFADLKRLELLGRMMRIYQKSGFENLIQKMGLMKLISRKLHEMSFMAPRVPKFRKYVNPNQRTEFKAGIGILAGCVQDVFFRDVNQDTIDVLHANGYAIYMPAKNSCCGSVHGHNGNLEMARQLARKLIDDFLQAGVQYVVLNSAGCGAYMKEYGKLLADDPDYAQKAEAFSAKVRDITEFLAENDWRIPEQSRPMTITYHEPCHLVHSQKVSAPPREILKNIPNIEFRELPESSWCCGSAGIYNVTRYEDAMQVLARKMENIKKTGVTHVVTGNPGCMIQLIYGTRKFNIDVEVIHPVSLLNQAYQSEGVRE